MKKLIGISLVVVALVVALVLATTGAFAGDGQIPSAKAAATSASIDRATTGWETIPELTVQIKTGTPKDLIIALTAETSLTTKVKLSGNVGSEAAATIEARVLVDGNEVLIPGNQNPEGGVVLDNRLLKLTGDLTHLNPLEPAHWIEIFMGTKSCHGFNFIAENVGVGVHTIEVQVKTSGYTIGEAQYSALIGNASLVVDEVNLK